MKEKRLTREGKIVAAGVCLVILAVAAYLGFRVYQARHFRLPFDPNSVESVVMYRAQALNAKKKIIDRKEDIKQITLLINGMRIWGPYSSSIGGGGAHAGGVATILSFRTSDGSKFNCCFTDYRYGDDGQAPSSIFSGGNRRFEMDRIDQQALWDGMDYGEQDVRLFDEIDPSDVSFMHPELRWGVYARDRELQDAGP